MINGEMKIFSGNANPGLANEICKYLAVNLSKAFVGRFSEGEVRVRIEDNVRGKDVFIIQPTCPPVNDNLMELLIMTDAIRRSSAKRITAVIPYFGYARQDRKDMPRVPITARLVANILTAAGTSRVLTIDLHASQIQGFFDIPLDHLFAVKVLMGYFEKKKIKNLVVVSPDVGGIKMARAYAKRINASLAIVDKRRVDDKETEVMNILGEVKGKNVVLVDDMITTAGSLVEAAQALKDAGAKDIYAAVTHPVLSGPAVERIKNSALKEVLVTNTIPVDASNRANNKVRVLSIAPLLGEAIKRIHGEESVSSLFD